MQINIQSSLTTCDWFGDAPRNQVDFQNSNLFEQFLRLLQVYHISISCVRPKHAFWSI